MLPSAPAKSQQGMAWVGVDGMPAVMGCRSLVRLEAVLSAAPLDAAVGFAAVGSVAAGSAAAGNTTAAYLTAANAIMATSAITVRRMKKASRTNVFWMLSIFSLLKQRVVSHRI
ncbi:MAG: hypothetical protein ABJZ55_12450 [Fuerstiella sp.]